MNGKLIVIEGLDGSGKSTQIERLKAKLLGLGKTVKQIKLPDYNSKSSELVKMYLGGTFGADPSDVNTYAASLFYTVDRYANYKTVWKDEYLNGALILADRYTTSNAVHQAVKLPKEKWDSYLDWLFETEYEKVGVPKPDKVIFLDMDVDISQRLMSQRYGGEESKKDVHESNIEYLKQCRQAALYTAERFDWTVIKCFDGENPLPIESISNEIFDKVRGIL